MANSGAKRSAVDAFLNFVRNKAIRTRVLALSLLFFAAKLGVEHLFFHDFLGVSEQDLSIVARFYQPITKTLGVRRKPQNCTLLRLQSPSAPQLEMGDCAFRSKLAQVLSKLVQYQPRGVLADYTLRNLECCSETARLIAALRRMKVHVPAIVVNAVGRGTCPRCRRILFGLAQGKLWADAAKDGDKEGTTDGATAT